MRSSANVSADNSSDHDAPAAPALAPRHVASPRDLFAKWARNFSIVGYLLTVTGCCAMILTKSLMANRYSAPDDPSAINRGIAFIAAFHGVMCFAIGIVCWALAARRPWQFGLREVFVATLLVAIAVVPVFRSCNWANPPSIRLESFEGPSVFVELHNMEMSSEPGTTFYLHDSYFHIPLTGVGFVVALLAAVAAAPLVFAAWFRRAYRWLHFRHGVG